MLIPLSFVESLKVIDSLIFEECNDVQAFLF